MQFSAVILAGGRSRRMGRDKAWIHFKGRPLIEQAIAAAQDAGADEILISGRREQDFTSVHQPVLPDIYPDCGSLSGIERALDCTKHPLVLVLAVDLPRMSPDFLRCLLDECTDQTGVVPVLREMPEPLVAVYPRKALEIARSMLAENRLAARDFAEACVGRGLAVTLPVEDQWAALFENWNFPGDVALEQG